MTLASNALTTFATVQSEVSAVTADQTYIEFLINVASDAIEGYCNRKFQKVSRTEKYDYPESVRLILKSYPIDTSVTPVITLNGTAITDFSIEDEESGIIWRQSGFGSCYPIAEPVFNVRDLPNSSKKIISVTYTGGYVLPKDVGSPTPVRTLPYDLEKACIDTVASLWRRKGRDLASATFDSTQEILGRGVGGLIPTPCLSTLKRYMRPDF